MKSVVVAALIALPLMAGTAMSDQSGRATFEPVTTKAADATAPVHRAKRATVAFDGVSLSAAEVKDVDANGDGEISFAELLKHDLKTDF